MRISDWSSDVCSSDLPANAAPVFDSLSGWQVLEGQQLAFSAFAWDPDNPYYTPPLRNAAGEVEETSATPQTVFVELASELPAGAEFDPATMQLRWTPDNGQAGDYELRFRAVDTADPDNVLVSEIVVPVTVFNQNRRPVVQAIDRKSTRLNSSH